MFHLDEDQQKKLANWLGELAVKNKDKCGGAIGGSKTYSFTPTNLGVVVTVYDEFTKETIDLTDYESW